MDACRTRSPLLSARNLSMHYLQALIPVVIANSVKAGHGHVPQSAAGASIDKAPSSHFQLSDILLDVKNSIAPAAHRKSLVCRTLLTNNVPDRLQGDPRAISIRLRDMALHAIDSTDEGLIQIAIEALETTTVDTLLRFTVTCSADTFLSAPAINIGCLTVSLHPAPNRNNGQGRYKLTKDYYRLDHD